MIRSHYQFLIGQSWFSLNLNSKLIFGLNVRRKVIEVFPVKRVMFKIGNLTMGFLFSTKRAVSLSPFQCSDIFHSSISMTKGSKNNILHGSFSFLF